MAGRKYQHEANRAKDAAIRSQRIRGDGDTWLDALDAKQPRKVIFRRVATSQASSPTWRPILCCRGWVVSLGTDGGGLIATADRGDIVLSPDSTRDQELLLWDDLCVEYKPHIRRPTGGVATAVKLMKRNPSRPSQLAARQMTTPRKQGGKKTKRKKRRAKR